MELEAKHDIQATRQLPKLKSLLKKYRQVKTMQTGLLKLSELANKVNSMEAFYPDLVDVVSSLLISDSFHIALLNKQQQLTLSFCHNPQEQELLNELEQQQWQDSLTGLVFRKKSSIHCNSGERMALASANKVSLRQSNCVDWLGVPLKRGYQTIGVMALKSYDNKLYFDDRDCQLLEFIAEHIVTAIDRVKSRALLEQNIVERTQKLTETNRRLQQEIAERQRIEQVQTTLLEISQISAAEQEIGLFYQQLHSKIKTLLPADNFYIALLIDSSNSLEFPYYIDEKKQQPDAQLHANPISQLVVNKIAATLITEEQGYYLSDGQTVQFNIDTLNKLRDKSQRSVAWLGAPLIEQGKVFGILALQDYHNVDAYQAYDLELIRFISQHISTAIIRQRTYLADRANQQALTQMVNERTQALQASNMKLRMQIEERKKAEAQLYHDAHHDTLTRLPNRAMFTDKLAYALRHIKRHPDYQFALLFIDLDRFKMINDTLGHQAGDEFLIEIACRLKQCIRDNDLLARLGGDEFVILLDSPHSQDDIEDIATRIIDNVAQPFKIQENQLFSNASIGISLSSPRYKSANEMLRDADAAMYQAKALGRARYVFFDESMRQQLIATMTLEQELHIAVQEQQFELYYQEILDLNHTKTIGYEALLRWQHPEKGILTPDQFLLTAEDTGLLLEIEQWVITQVCQRLAYWQTDELNKHAFISINLSGKHLIHPNHLSLLLSTIKQYAKDPEQLILEFNEASFAQHTELALQSLRKLKELGVKLALDDYCSGFSSFNFLHSYPFEFIKLDRGFIKSIVNNDRNLNLVKALNNLGEQFGYRLVAEGIENQDMLEKLQNAGCEFGQGYHINKPTKLEALASDCSEDIYQAHSA